MTSVELERVVDFLRAPPGLGGEEGSWKGSMPFQVGAADPIEMSSIDSRFGGCTAAKWPACRPLAKDRLSATHERAGREFEPARVRRLHSLHQQHQGDR